MARLTKEEKRLEAIASAVVAEVDYDIWKSLYVPERVEDPEEAPAARKRLREAVRAALAKT